MIASSNGNIQSEHCPLPTGIQTFSTLREECCYHVDSMPLPPDPGNGLPAFSRQGEGGNRNRLPYAVDELRSSVANINCEVAPLGVGRTASSLHFRRGPASRPAIQPGREGGTVAVLVDVAEPLASSNPLSAGAKL